ncbi:S8/S53 family peptidase [Ponticaulis sp.]|uniref:S8 family peptidase n=1 Tax=Ponticaulis sp. TaxID=2020902 RepID=UPI0026299A19|nr:S8/S53 family peptidase [Ponticaulis sp.]MDF1680681.1 S8/S53 family peptidase [Ponticaulis sp.]
METDRAVEMLQKEFGGDFELDHRIIDVLQANDVELRDQRLAQTLPFVARVPFGEEFNFASKFASLQFVGMASPDFLVQPASATIQLNDAEIAKYVQAISSLAPARPQCGDGVRIAMLDSGVDLNVVTAGKTAAIQYDTYDPISGAVTPFDTTGHGSCVAQIIGSVVPGAEKVSIRTFEHSGALSNVVAGLFLISQLGPFDVINMSFSLDAFELCNHCGLSQLSAFSMKQIEFFFRSALSVMPNSIAVAAAGNTGSSVQLPAMFDDIFAVGSFDYAQMKPISTHINVPNLRYVLAPGGMNSPSTSFGEASIGLAQAQQLFGTSFATAYISGLAGKVACGETGQCRSISRLLTPSGHIGSLRDKFAAILKANSSTRWSGFDASKHGFGCIG